MTAHGSKCCQFRCRESPREEPQTSGIPQKWSNQSWRQVSPQSLFTGASNLAPCGYENWRNIFINKRQWLVLYYINAEQQNYRRQLLLADLTYKWCAWTVAAIWLWPRRVRWCGMQTLRLNLNVWKSWGSNGLKVHSHSPASADVNGVNLKCCFPDKLGDKIYMCI